MGYFFVVLKLYECSVPTPTTNTEINGDSRSHSKTTPKAKPRNIPNRLKRLDVSVILGQNHSIKVPLVEDLSNTRRSSRVKSNSPSLLKKQAKKGRNTRGWKHFEELVDTPDKESSKNAEKMFDSDSENVS